MRKRSNEPVSVTIRALKSDGCGYSEDGQMAVMNALPGETLLARPVTRRRKQLIMRGEDLVGLPSPDRVTPICEVASYCGGCSFQHLRHDEQLRLKQSSLAAELSPVEPATWMAPLTGATSGYRSKARLGVKHVHKKNRVLVGFREAFKPYITDTPQCPVLVEPVDGLHESLSALVSGLQNPESIPQVELAAGDERTALVFRHLEPLSDSDLDLLRTFSTDHEIDLFLQPGGIESTYKLAPDDGVELLSYRLPEFDLTFRFSPHDFTQVNLPMNRAMVSLAVSLLDLHPDDVVFDAFCGIGNFSLALSRSATKVVAAELSESSIQRAVANAELNGIENVDFEVADLFKEPIENKGLASANKVLLDPPRSGALSLVKTLATSDVERVVYVSCNPETLARDVKVLVANGFECRAAGIIDMFPHTTHVESIALLVRSERPVQVPN